MFRGASKVTLDAKGRLAIPSKYRESLLARGDGKLIATIDRDRCLLLYPLPDWEDIERRLDRMPGLRQQVRQQQRHMLGYATDLEMDGHGRILLTRELRAFAGLEKQAMLVGQGKKFELWDEERWNAGLEAWLASGGRDGEPLDPELAELLL